MADDETPEALLLRQQDVLARFGELALRSDDLDDILHQACRLVGEALGTDLAKVMELQEDRTTLIVRAGVGWQPGVVGRVTVKAERGSSEGYALQTGQPVMSADVDAETRFEYADFIKEAGVKAIASVIILGAEGKPPFGILQVDSRSPRHFDERDTKFLRGYANLLAAAVDRLRVAYEMRVAQEALQTSEAALRLSNETLEARAEERSRALLDAEEALRHSQKLEAVGLLTGGIAHDFNNMLQTISICLEMARRRVEQARSADALPLMREASEGVERAAALTYRLLAFARRQALDAKAVAAQGLIVGILALIERAVGPSVEVRTEMGARGWSVLCDPNQVENALLNLAFNARDAMPEGGVLTVSTENVVLTRSDVAGYDGVEPGDFVGIGVADTGCGMTPDVLAHAFEPFFTTKPVGYGTGLGLSQIYGFVRQSGGLVRLESTAGHGTMVRLLLPRYRGTSETSPVQLVVRGESDDGAGSVVLLVEDVTELRMVTSAALRELGYIVREAGDGPAALRLLEVPCRIDILVTDVGLPGMNGRQLAEAARERRPTLPVLFITGFAGVALHEEPHMGMEVLGKPFKIEALAARVRRMVDRSQGERPT